MLEEEYEYKNGHEIHSTYCESEEEAISGIRKYVRKIFGNNKRIKIKPKSDDGFYFPTQYVGKSNDASGLNTKESTDRIYEYCPTYNIREGVFDEGWIGSRGNYYACYRNTNDKSTLEFWYAHAKKPE